ncbi:methyl-accepting chemotaxis protein [Magnetospira sp. QH-2]|uniref:methyl-accepting chemotaxis protein n=1 Tax=Magnetospira sp. (strain QH-2) TaxID=1288970 RepID=UPI0003E81BB7|nr:methyl-accepting chemotaxis protein [Magnetospira sp. QH-2]CCQ73853.1 Chemotaxis methyl-accepting receptor, signalling [Magnetospira sp. QH-2]
MDDLANRDAGDLEASLRHLERGEYRLVPEGITPFEKEIHQLSCMLHDRARHTLRGLIEVSVECGDSMVSLAEMYRDMREVSNRSQGIAAAAEEMVASVTGIAQTSEAAAQDAYAVREAAGNGMDAAQRAVETMHNIAGAVEDAANKVDTLAKASEEIGDIVQSIEAIAKQTNLLALNATIEAARAGEAGKGFAVVAGEVKNLANQTAKATDNIRSRIGTLRGEMEAIVGSMQQGARAVQEGEDVILATGDEMQVISDQVDGVNAKMHDIASILNQQRQASSEVSSGINLIADMTNRNTMEITKLVGHLDSTNDMLCGQVSAFAVQDIDYKVVDLAKSDHVAFKRRIMDALIGRIALGPDDLDDHHHCRLGKWYDEVTDPAIARDPAFLDLAVPHEQVHSVGRETLQRLAQGDLDGALESAHQMLQASAQVLGLLDQLGDNLDRKGELS